MQPRSIKEQARRLLDNLPDSATRDDVMYRIYVRQAVEYGRPLKPGLRTAIRAARWM